MRPFARDRARVHSALFALVALGAATYLILKPTIAKIAMEPDAAQYAYRAWHLIEGGNSWTEERRHVTLAGRELPLAAAYYRGPWEIYGLTPFVWLSPDRLEAVRRFTLLGALLCVLSTYALVFVVSESVLLALLAGLTFATAPYWHNILPAGFVFAGVTDVGPACLAVAALILALRDGSRVAWLASCALLGLSIGIAPQAAATVVGWSLSILWWMTVRPSWRPPGGWRARLLAAAALSLGVAPLLLSNVLYDWHGARAALDALSVTPWGAENARYLQNLLMRLGHAGLMLGFGEHQRWPAALIALACLGGLALLRLRPASAAAGKTWPPPAAVLLIFPPAIILTSPFTLFHFDAYHLLMLWPSCLGVLAALPKLLEGSRLRHGRAAVAALLFAALLHNSCTLSRHADVEKPRQGIWSVERTDAMARLADWLVERRPNRVYGFANGDGVILHLTAGRAPRRDEPWIHWNLGAKELEPRVVPGETGLLVFEFADDAAPTEALLRSLRELGAARRVRVRRLAEFRMSDGRPAYEVYGLGPL